MASPIIIGPLAIRLGHSLTACDVTPILEELFRRHGRPACIRSGNGPEIVVRHVQKRRQKKKVDTQYIDPGVSSPVKWTTLK